MRIYSKLPGSWYTLNVYFSYRHQRLWITQMVLFFSPLSFQFPFVLLFIRSLCLAAFSVVHCYDFWRFVSVVIGYGGKRSALIFCIRVSGVWPAEYFYFSSKGRVCVALAAYFPSQCQCLQYISLNSHPC